MLISENELKTKKARELIPFLCPNCDKTFFRTKNYVMRWLKGTYHIESCSTKCYKELKYKEANEELKCVQCGKSFEAYKKTNRKFCSHSCAAVYNNTHKTYGTRRSKLETWLEKQLAELYPSLEIHYNRKDAINSELDIYIPSMKLAFELNGIFHYEPIFGHNKLDNIQNNDNRKFQACLERGIQLCIIDVSQLSYFKPKKAQKYLDIIIKIINGCPLGLRSPAPSIPQRNSTD